MQNKGALKFLAIMLAVACAFQLSFSFVTQSVQNKAAAAAAGDHTAETEYLDSMKSQVVYNLGLFKYTYAECLEKEINLGLDLRGGMNVTLEIAVEDVLKALAGPNDADPTFTAAMVAAKQAQKNSTDDYITLFYKAYTEANPTGRLAAIFGTYDLREKITPESTNDQVIAVLRTESESAIANSFNVLSNRIDRFGVVQPNVQRLENTGRILIELPGVKDPDRVRKLLQGTANLEFWTTYIASEIYPFMNQANSLIAKLNSQAVADSVLTDTTLVAEVLQTDSTDIVAALATTATDTTKAATAADGLDAKNYPLFSALQPSDAQSPVVGVARSYDTTRVNKMLALPQVKALFPRDVKFMWGIKGVDLANTTFELYAIKLTTNGKAPLDGGAVEDANGQYTQQGSSAEVSMSMNAAGAKVWARLTADNIGRFVAIVLDDFVYSAPVVRGEISGGNSSISGNFTIQEAKDLANVLKSGKLPAPARIVQDSVVGPTLGQESINAGMSSFVLAFVLVLIYMILFYNTAGMVASVALVTNLFFLFGVLVSFGAVLTLPGIAGIVL
ncbi:MAG: protein translocase subunit SecD, partial [Mucinivorans sp.]